MTVVNDQLTLILREKVHTLFAEGVADVFIGYRHGGKPLRVQPHVARSAADADQLVWNPTCINNLTSTLHKFADMRVGILVKGCDSRALVELIKLRQVRRDGVYIIGAPCPGIVDHELIARSVDPATITDIFVEEAQVMLTTDAGEITLDPAPSTPNA